MRSKTLSMNSVLLAMFTPISRYMPSNDAIGVSLNALDPINIVVPKIKEQSGMILYCVFKDKYVCY